MLKRVILSTMCLVLAVSAARADIIFLKDGRVLHVDVTSADERGVNVKRLDNGGKLFVRWNLIRVEDQKKLRIRFGLEEEVAEEELLIDGHRIEPKLGQFYDGIIESSTQEVVVLRHDGRLMPFKRDAIRKIDARPVSVFDVYTPKELYDQKIAEIKPAETDAAGHFECGKWAGRIGMYTEAMIHFAKVREASPEYKADFIENQLKRLDYLEKNKFIRDAIKTAVRSGTLRRFDKSMETFDQILAEKDLDQAIREEVEKLKVKFTKRRWAHFSKLVVRGYYREVDRELRAIAGSRKIKSSDPEEAMTLGKAQSELRGKLHKKIVETLAKKHELDPKKEVEKMWKDRSTRATRTASYGSGTFIVSKGNNAARQRQRQQAAQRQKLLEQANRNRRGRRNQQQQQAQAPKVKLLTKDEWWKTVDSSARLFFLRAFYAENTQNMEVVSKRKRNCTQCGGAGSLRQLGAQGGFIKLTCPRCQGNRHDQVIVYR